MKKSLLLALTVTALVAPAHADHHGTNKSAA